MITIYRPFHLSNNRERNKELSAARAYTLFNTPNDRIKERSVNNGNTRMNYLDLFRQAFEFEKGTHESNPIFFCNSDIAFDSTILLAEDHLKDGDFWAISRIEVIDRKRFGGQYQREYIPFHHAYSQDVWAMTTNTLHEVVKAFSDPLAKSLPQMGIPGCENILASRMFDLGLNVKNPCKSINAFHFHQSGIRTYSERDRLPKDEYLFVEPCAL